MTLHIARYRRPAGMALAIAVLAAACVAYVRHVHWADTLGVMRHASLLTLALSTGFHLMSLLSKAGVWSVCLRALGASRYRTAARATLVGATLNSLFMGSAGEAGRVVIMTRATGLRAYAVATTVALERLFNVGGFVVVLCVAMVIAPLTVAIRRAGLTVVVIAVVAIGLACRFRGDARRSGTARRSGSGASRFRRIVQLNVRRIAKIARRVVTPRLLAAAVPLTLMDWTFQLVSYHLVARAAHLSLGITGSLVALLAVNLGLVIRVTPGNIGVFELAYATAAHSLGAPMDAALGVGTLIHLAQDLPTIALGVMLGRQLVFVRRPAIGRVPTPTLTSIPAVCQTASPGRRTL
jgi:uncharacterized protein (TIRG00374 family)